MSTILGYILGFLISISGAYFLAKKLKTSIAKTLPFYLLGFPLVVYLFSLVGQMKLGYILVILLSLIPTAIHLLKTRKNLNAELRELRAPSFILICATFLLLGAINFGRSFHAWDDFMHWGPFAKETYRNLELYNSENSLVEVHRDYPPIITIYETFWLFLSGEYNESILFIALQFLQISLFMPFVDKLKWQKDKKYKLKFAGLAIALVIAPAVITLGDDYYFATIMTDTLIAMLFAFALANIFTAKAIDQRLFVKLACVFAFLILVKQISLAFIAIAWACLVVRTLLEKRKKKLGIILLSIIPVIVSLIFTMLWTMRIEKLGIEGQFQISALIEGVKSGTSSMEKWQLITVKNFIKAYLYEVDIALGLSYFKLTVLFCVAATILAYFNKEKRKLIIASSALIVLSSVAYALLMMLLYAFCFSDVEGPALASYTRYLGTFWLAIVMFGFSLLLNNIQAKNLSKLPNIGIIAILAVILIANPASLGLAIFRNHDQGAYDRDVSLITKHVQAGQKVYIISQDSNGVHNVRLKYLLNPIETNPTYSTAFAFGPETDEDIWTSSMSKDELANTLQQYDYVYLYNAGPATSDNYFATKFNKLFDEYPKTGNLYKKDGEKFVLVDSLGF